jgi:ABC-type dipeptide/oligopeptide/nickel transport system permease subunit
VSRDRRFVARSVEGIALPGRAPIRGSTSWRRLIGRPTTVVAAVFLVALVVVAVFADAIAPYGPQEQFLRVDGTADATTLFDPLADRASGKFEAPSRAHLFGTDELARDIFSRTVIGLRISLAAAVFALVAVVLLGVTVGAAAVAGPIWMDRTLMRVTDVAYAFPDLLLIILLRAAFGNELFGYTSVAGISTGVWLLALAISLTAWPTMARLVRGRMLVLREQEFSTAAIALGAGQRRLVVRHWLPNLGGPVIVEATFIVPRAIFAEAALSFIGIGVTPPTPSLGVLMASHFSFVAVQWTALAIPVALLVCIFLAFQVLGDGLRDALDPRMGR